MLLSRKFYRYISLLYSVVSLVPIFISYLSTYYLPTVKIVITVFQQWYGISKSILINLYIYYYY